MAITDKDWDPEHHYGITRKRAIELGEDAEYPRISAAVFHFDKLTPEEQATVIKHKEKELSDALEERKQVYRSAKESADISRKLNLRPGEMSPYPRQKKQAKERIDMLQKSVDRLKNSVKVSKPANNMTSGLAVKKVKGGYDVIHTKSGNRLMPFSYPERELATDFARRAGQVGVDWTRPFPDLQKESEKIADLIRGGEKPGMFEKVLDMPTTFPKIQAEKKEPWQMTIKQYEKDMRDYWAGTRGTGPGSRSLPEDMAERFREYHRGLIEQALSEGKPVPAEVLADYPDLKKQAEVEAKKQFEGKWAKAYGGRPETVKGSTAKAEKELAKLQAIHDSRSPRSRESDERQSNADTIEPDDPRVDIWERDPGRMDVAGIDTPRKHKGKTGKGKKPVRKSKRASKVETQVRGIKR